MARKKPAWRQLYLDAKDDLRRAQWNLDTVCKSLHELHAVREGDEDRFAEERGQLQRRIDELEGALERIAARRNAVIDNSLSALRYLNNKMANRANAPNLSDEEVNHGGSDGDSRT